MLDSASRSDCSASPMGGEDASAGNRGKPRSLQGLKGLKGAECFAPADESWRPTKRPALCAAAYGLEPAGKRAGLEVDVNLPPCAFSRGLEPISRPRQLLRRLPALVRASSPLRLRGYLRLSMPQCLPPDSCVEESDRAQRSSHARIRRSTRKLVRNAG